MSNAQINISHLGYQELGSLQVRVGERMQELQQEGRKALAERFAQEAAVLGLTLGEVSRLANGKRGGRKKSSATILNSVAEGEPSEMAAD